MDLPESVCPEFVSVARAVCGRSPSCTFIGSSSWGWADPATGSGWVPISMIILSGPIVKRDADGQVPDFLHGSGDKHLPGVSGGSH